MTGFAQGADFTNPEAVGQPGAAFGELECAFFSVGMGECLRGELTGIPVGAGVFVVGENGDALGFETGKKFGRVAFAVEDESEAVAEGFGFKLLDCGLAGDVVEEAGEDFFFEGFLQARVDGFCDAEEGGSIEGVDPVVGGAAQAELFAAHIAAGQLGGFAVIDAHMAVDEEHAGGFDIMGHPIFGQIPAPSRGAFLVIAEHGDFRAQSFDFGDAVEAEEFSPFPGRVVAELLEARNASQRQIGEQEEDGLHGIKSFGSAEVAFRVAQESEGEQCGKCAKHSAVRDIIGPLETRFGSLQSAEGSGNSFHRAGGRHSHGGFSIGDAASGLVAGCGGLGGLGRRAGNDHLAGAFFLSRPARMAL